jgi:hypothetical protein
VTEMSSKQERELVAASMATASAFRWKKARLAKVLAGIQAIRDRGELDDDAQAAIIAELKQAS